MLGAEALALSPYDWAVEAVEAVEAETLLAIEVAARLCGAWMLVIGLDAHSAAVQMVGVQHGVGTNAEAIVGRQPPVPSRPSCRQPCEPPLAPLNT